MRMQINVRKVNIVAVLLLSLVHSDCASARSVELQCETTGYEFFYDIARAQREFVSFSLEKKYAVLICATQGIHPLRLEFASLFATEGGYSYASDRARVWWESTARPGTAKACYARAADLYADCLKKCK